MLYARGTVPQHSRQSIHSAKILPLHSSRHSLCCNHAVAIIISRTHPSSCSQYLHSHTGPRCRRTRTALACHNAALSTLATSFWLMRRARLSGKAARQGGKAGLVVAGRWGGCGWGGGPGRVASRVGWRAGSVGGPGQVAGRGSDRDGSSE